MDNHNMSCFNNHLGTSSPVFIHVTCVVPFCASNNNNVVPMSSSSPHTPKKIINKIIKAIIPYLCIKTEQQQEDLSVPSYNSKKIAKKISKAILYQCFKTKQQEDERCLWKKTILMGEKCQPLEFSGAIFYDSKGNQLSEPPRSPRTPLISFGRSLSTQEA